MRQTDPFSFKNWLPLKLFEKENKIWVEWIFMGIIEYTDPFFDGTITKFKLQNSLNPKQVKNRITPLEFLIDVAHTIESVEPNLFIFHTSRCGSTLVTQILSLDKQNIVVPEYTIIDAIFRINENSLLVSKSFRVELLKSIVAIVGQKRTPAQKRLIIKLDSWHFAFFNEVQELFPKSNSIIIYNEPEFILKSIAKIPGIQFIQEIISPEYYNLDKINAKKYAAKKYQNCVLKKMYSFIYDISMNKNHIILLDYSNGMQKNMIPILQLLKMPPNFINIPKIQQRFFNHSKKPEISFIQETIVYNNLTYKATRNAYHKLSNLKNQVL